MPLIPRPDFDVQASPPTPPTPPTPPGPATAPAGVNVGNSTLPITSDIEALRDRRNELSNQLNSATGRRDDALKALRNTPEGPARQGADQLVQTLNERINTIEQDIAANGRMLANAPLLNSESQATNRYGPFSSGQLTGITIVSIVLVWAPLAFAAARIMLRRWAHPKPAPQVLESAARLERMEQAIDAVAIEVERISEGQRFVTQTIAKRESPAALGVGQAPAEPIKVAAAEQIAR